MKGKIRFAKPEDAKAILGIYAPYIENTAITFEYEVPSEEEFSARMEEIQKKYPWIVYEEEGEILGYAYGGPEYTRAAYQWTVETSVYVAAEASGKGIGTALYEKILDILKKQNFCVCYVLINDDNEASVKLHEKYGFKQNGFRKNCGYKFEKWHSVVFMEKQLNEFSVPPKAIIPINELNYEF
ncbi:MAG: N-acetyltransferase [Oscillospiraceae bacterium]|nr:N-acetyltransferase [Oscillospiraceae bacterium]